MNDYLEGIIRNLPDLPGCYQYLDESGTVIYVGKAKNLKRRVSSYFNREHDSLKTQMLVKKIRDIRYIVVKTNEESLLLENNLIKKYKPRYNVLLKDDKTYPWIILRKEPFPRVESTRQLRHDGSLYFGPYGSISMQRSVLEFIREVIPLRTCKLSLTDKNITSGKK